MNQTKTIQECTISADIRSKIVDHIMQLAEEAMGQDISDWDEDGYYNTWAETIDEEFIPGFEVYASVQINGYTHTWTEYHCDPWYSTVESENHDTDCEIIELNVYHGDETISEVDKKLIINEAIAKINKEYGFK